MTVWFGACLSLGPDDIETAQAVAIAVGRRLAFIGVPDA